MLAPLSWLKDFVDITLTPEKLGERLTEVGLNTEKITKVDDDIIFEFEVTPNRPDLLSIVGIAREIAAIENKEVKLKAHDLAIPDKTTLPMTLHTDYALCDRWTAVSIASVTVKPSSKKLQDRLKKIGLRSINNIVDITNYVMFELGIPLHAFDYDNIDGNVMTVAKAVGGERFTTVDEKTYSLPKDAIIIKDAKQIIDLVGIKGGLNSGITANTKNVFLHTTTDNPILIRRASQALGLRSDASAIYERGVNKGGTLDTLKRAVQLILEETGGNVASEIIDIKKDSFEPWTVELTHEKLTKILGIALDPKEIISLFKRLNLTTVQEGNGESIRYTVTIPTYRNDLKIPEDLIEEIARLYGYNNFPKTIPEGVVPTMQIPYFKNYKVDEKVKNILTACGFSEVMTYSLVSEGDLADCGYSPKDCLRVDNPVSRDFEYLRPELKGNLKKALTANKPFFKRIELFELGKIFTGKTIDKAKETYQLCGVSNYKSFEQVKGVVEKIYQELGNSNTPTDAITIEDDALFFTINYSEMIAGINLQKTFHPVPKYPSIAEDLALVVKPTGKIGEIIVEIKKQSNLITEVSLLDEYESTKTFHIVYQHTEKNLTNEDVSLIRKKILKHLLEKFQAKPKE